MLTVKKNCQEVDSWNLKAKNLVKDLENTIDGFSKLLTTDKENYEIKNRTIPIKAFKSLTESGNSYRKADPNTLKKIIRAGIYNLRKSNSPLPCSPLNQSVVHSYRSSSIELISKLNNKVKNEAIKKRRKTQRGRSLERNIKKNS